MINKICLYWHTLRYLRLSQFYERLKFNLLIPKPDYSPAPALRSNSGLWVRPIQPSKSLVGSKEFSFFREQGSLEAIGWDGKVREKLWRYNQHYFNDLNASSASERNEWHLDILKNWVEQNPPVSGVGWESYPTSLRIINWIKWSLAGNTLPEPCIQSLAIQVRFLSKRLEKHLLGNHLLANAKALIFAGLFFQSDEATVWLKMGLQIMESELTEQILEDGGHFERSPMYHSIVLEDLLDLINISQLWHGSIDSSVSLGWIALVKKMFLWLEVMTHPDGQISFFNDAAFGIASSFENLLKYADSLGIELGSNFARSILTVHKLDQSGYIQLRSRDAVLYLDVAPVGPDYLPGHAHADTLSFEMSIFEQRVIVNGGTSRYGLSPERLQERQTKSHSTVEVNGQSSSEVWGGFRVARRAQPFDLRIISTEDEISVRCSHDGYARLKGRPIHRREWNMTKTDLTISDSVTGDDCRSIARFIMHPSVVIEKLNINNWCIYTPHGHKVLFRILSGNSFAEPATYAPEFGVVLQTQCIAIELTEGKSRARLQWN